MAELHDEIADLEAAIDELSLAAEQCRKLMVVGRLGVVGGSLMLAVLLLGLARLGPAWLIFALTSVIGGIVLAGSNSRTREEMVQRLAQHEARRAELIDGLALQEARTLPDDADLAPGRQLH
jgi:hypothetical protein